MSVIFCVSFLDSGGVFVVFTLGCFRWLFSAPLLNRWFVWLFLLV